VLCGPQIYSLEAILDGLWRALQFCWSPSLGHASVPIGRTLSGETMAWRLELFCRRNHLGIGSLDGEWLLGAPAGKPFWSARDSLDSTFELLYSIEACEQFSSPPASDTDRPELKRSVAWP